MKNFYTNVEVIKLREYRLSYGTKETLKYDTAIETDKYLEVYINGHLDRKMLKSAKYFISFKGKQVTELAFKRKNTSSKKAWDLKRKKIEEDYNKKQKITASNIVKMEIEFKTIKPKIQQWVNTKKIDKITHQGSKGIAFKVQNLFKSEVNIVGLARLIRENIKPYKL